MKEKICGNCRHFDHEDMDGYGWCYKQSANADCEGSCSMHEYNYNGWTELTNDNKNELTEELLKRIVVGVMDKHGRMYTMTLLDCRLGIGEMANLGGFYYYVLPELKIE